MSLQVTCPACAANFSLPAETRGKKAVCPECGDPLVVTSAGVAKRDEGPNFNLEVDGRASGMPARSGLRRSAPPSAVPVLTPPIPVQRRKPLWIVVLLLLLVVGGLVLYILTRKTENPPAPEVASVPPPTSAPTPTTRPEPKPDPDAKADFFVGRWRALTDTGKTAAYFTLTDSFEAKKDYAPKTTGKWRLEGNGIRIVWSDGWIDVWQREGAGVNVSAYEEQFVGDPAPTLIRKYRAEKMPDKAARDSKRNR